ncbi:metal ABC transporter solute-binding protein, Zn/Mn family [Halegenticoccus tardaugens]|uniref:metal ABC transporter solute-binding protein, Zn/Mn family n=1 Tax=Halegenticoccus tardaugens TaxID=2071624 RepID=UPI00100AB8C6|nr:zinc ABC transporter substrate-binding protein [Halegenticoccus tardaugens]
MSGHTRREVLGLGAGALASTALAGCLEGIEDGAAGSGDGEAIQASFFVLYDFARNVTGDAATVGNLVPFGQHGHGWEPGPDIQRSVAQSDAFVYMGEGFQPWADKVVQNVRDNDEDVAIIEARTDVELLGAPEEEGGHEGEHDHGDEEHDEEHEGEGEHDEGDHNESDAGHEGSGDHDESDGSDHNESEGHSHDESDEHAHDEEHEDGHDEGDEGGHEGHDHGSEDPHFWLDPTRAATAVDTIAAGLSEVRADDGSTFADNAEAYTSKLEELDEEFASALENRDRDDVLVAGHNAFQYLGERYDFTVHALTGLAPDSQASPQDVKRAQELIEEHDITHVLAPVFESDRAANQLVEETDAEEAVPLTPIPSTTEEWDEKGWGFVDVMREVNLPSLRKALGAE